MKKGETLLYARPATQARHAPPCLSRGNARRAKSYMSNFFERHSELKNELKVTCEYELVEQVIEYAAEQGDFVNITCEEYNLAYREVAGSEYENILLSVRLERSPRDIRKGVRRLHAEKLLNWLKSGEVWEHINAEYMLNHLGRGLLKAGLVYQYVRPYESS